MAEQALAYIGLGSNLGNSRETLDCALSALADHTAISELRCSAYFGSVAVGPGEQGNYINAVASFCTSLNAEQLLETLQAQEQAAGRVRLERWGPRTLDLDLLLYRQDTIDLPHLQVPHPRLRERDFVLYPLFDLAPELVFADGTSLRSLLDLRPTPASHTLWRLDETTAQGTSE